MPAGSWRASSAAADPWTHADQAAATGRGPRPADHLLPFIKVLYFPERLGPPQGRAPPGFERQIQAVGTASARWWAWLGVTQGRLELQHGRPQSYQACVAVLGGMGGPYVVKSAAMDVRVSGRLDPFNCWIGSVFADNPAPMESRAM